MMKKTKNGTAISPVVDIAPQINFGYHNRERVRDEMKLLADFGFDRVYFVVCNPGHPQFSSPGLSLIPPHNNLENMYFRSLIALGDPNAVYAGECRRQGMEAIAIYKPYEGGGGTTIPSEAFADFATTRVKSVGGDRIYFDTLLTEQPELAVKHKPVEGLLNLDEKEITAIEVTFIEDPFNDRSAESDTYTNYRPTPISEVQDEFFVELWVSKDNHKYEKYERAYKVSFLPPSYEEVECADGKAFDHKIKTRKIRIEGLMLESCFSYIAFIINSKGKHYTIPATLVRMYSENEILPSTTTQYIRKKTSEAWGQEGDPFSISNCNQNNIHDFTNSGFEFEWLSNGFWGKGITSCSVYCIAKGVNMYMKGTPCEGYDSVRKCWLENVMDYLDMGFDGIDFRMQYHSGMVQNYNEYGYNEPIIRLYKEVHGVNILQEKADPLKLMEIRGQYYEQFLETAAFEIRKKGKTMQAHLRHANQEPKISCQMNELGFWAMPKIQVNWKNIVDMSDEITLKDYYHNNYRPQMSDRIKQEAKSQGKRVWAHCYISQGPELNEEFINKLDSDDSIGGILLYETADIRNNSFNHEGLINVGGSKAALNPKNASILHKILKNLEYQQ